MTATAQQGILGEQRRHSDGTARGFGLHLHATLQEWGDGNMRENLYGGDLVMPNKTAHFARRRYLCAAAISVRGGGIPTKVSEHTLYPQWRHSRKLAVKPWKGLLGMPRGLLDMSRGPSSSSSSPPACGTRGPSSNLTSLSASLSRVPREPSTLCSLCPSFAKTWCTSCIWLRRISCAGNWLAATSCVAVQPLAWRCDLLRGGALPDVGPAARCIAPEYGQGS
jgi:hypothetical protein